MQRYKLLNKLYHERLLGAEYFDDIKHDLAMELCYNIYYLNHYPIKAVEHLSNTYEFFDMAMVRHIHGLWKVQRNIINVSVDSWHFKPVSEKEIGFLQNAMLNYYDKNVFLC